MLTPIHKQAHSISAQTTHFLFSTIGIAEKKRRFLWWSNPHVRHLTLHFPSALHVESKVMTDTPGGKMGFEFLFCYQRQFQEQEMRWMLRCLPSV